MTDDELTPDQSEAIDQVIKRMADYDRGIKDATDSLRKRIIALEILLQQKDMRIRYLEEELYEIKGHKRIKPQKEVNDEQ